MRPQGSCRGHANGKFWKVTFVDVGGRPGDYDLSEVRAARNGRRAAAISNHHGSPSARTRIISDRPL